MSATPPRLSTWLLSRFAPHHRRESLIGDLHEQLHAGRSIWWYRRQVVTTIAAGVATDVTSHWVLALRALAVGWSLMFALGRIVSPAIEESRLTLFRTWGPALWGDSEVIRQLWVYYGLPFVLLACAMFMAVGWIVGRLHRRHAPALLALFTATLIVPAVFQTLASLRLMEAGLWPGWQLGSFRWALVFHAVLQMVVYPLCALMGGLWSEPASSRSARGYESAS